MKAEHQLLMAISIVRTYCKSQSLKAYEFWYISAFEKDMVHNILQRELKKKTTLWISNKIQNGILSEKEEIGGV